MVQAWELILKNLGGALGVTGIFTLNMVANGATQSNAVSGLNIAVNDGVWVELGGLNGAGIAAIAQVSNTTGVDWECGYK